MRVYYGAESILAEPCRPVVTTGSFDGVHYGHRILLGELKRLAAEIDGQSVVVTFAPHPRCVLKRGGDLKLLNTIDEKILLLEQCGIDVLVVLPFTEEFSKMSAGDFVRTILVGRIGMKAMVVGYDHRFGCDGSMGFESLRLMGQQMGFGVCRVEQQNIGSQKISSTVVRKAIENGDMGSAAIFLEHNYIMYAAVKDGYLVIDEPHKLLPPAGRYEVLAGGTDSMAGVRDVLTVTSQGAMKLERFDRPVGGADEKILIEFCGGC